MARRLIREEGLLCGGSSGTAMVGALQAIKELNLKKGSRVVVILPDSVRNYMTKFLKYQRLTSDGWMKSHGYIDEQTEKLAKIEKDQWNNATIRDLKLQKAVTVPAAISIKNAIEIMKNNSFDQLPVTSASDSKHCVGLVTLGGLLAKLNSNRLKITDTCESAMYCFKTTKKFVNITMDTPLSKLGKFFETNSSAVVTETSEIGELLIVSICTKVDLLSFLTKSLSH